MSVGTASAGVGCLTEWLLRAVRGWFNHLNDARDREFLIRLYYFAEGNVSGNGTVYEDNASVVGMGNTAAVGIDLLDIKCELCTLLKYSKNSSLFLEERSFAKLLSFSWTCWNKCKNGEAFVSQWKRLDGFSSMSFSA